MLHYLFRVFYFGSFYSTVYLITITVLIKMNRYHVITQLCYILIIIRYTGRAKRCLNLSSYNYLGFAENSGPCTDAVESAIEKYGLSTCASRLDFGKISYSF